MIKLFLSDKFIGNDGFRKIDSRNVGLMLPILLKIRRIAELVLNVLNQLMKWGFEVSEDYSEIGLKLSGSRFYLKVGAWLERMAARF